jgi:hypothetical protein
MVFLAIPPLLQRRSVTSIIPRPMISGAEESLFTDSLKKLSLIPS